VRGGTSAHGFSSNCLDDEWSEDSSIFGHGEGQAGAGANADGAARTGGEDDEGDDGQANTGTVF
jgi:hypothetical protein